MLEQLTITPAETLATIVATVVLYLTMVAMIRLLGQRMISSLSSFDVAAVIAFGSILGRATLGDRPRLMSGIVALCTLVAIQALVGQIRTTRAGAQIVAVKPVLLMAGSRSIEANMRRCHVTEAELRSRLRLAGIGDPGEVAAVIFEPSGGISVLRRGVPLSSALLADVVGAEQLENR